MTLSSRPFFALCITSILAAQSPVAVLKLIPDSASSVELTWRPAESTERYLKATATLGEKNGLVDLEGLAHLSLADVATGTIAEVHFADRKDTQASGKAKKSAAKSGPESKTPDWKVLMVPVKNAQELSKRLHAKPAGTVQRYEWKTDAGVQERYLGFRSGYALVSERKTLLEQTLKPGPSLQPELTPLLPWLQEHDLVLVITEKAIRQAVDEFGQSGDPGSPTNALSGIFKGLGDKVRASVHHGAVALDLPKDGSLRILARAFFKPGSPLASEAASLPAISGHPLGRLPEGPYALAMGGHWPPSLRFFQKMAGQFPNLKAEDQEQMGKLTAKVNEQVLGTSFRLRAPKAGEPFLQGMTGVSVLKDGKAWMAAIKQQQGWSQEHLGGAFSYQEGVLPEVPSLTVSVDLGKLAGDKLPPAQMAMIGGLLFGGSRMLISYAVIDEHSLAYTFGDKDALKALVTEVQQRKPLSATRQIQSSDPLLPKDGRFLLYLDPRGIQTLVSAVMKSFTGKDVFDFEVAETLPLVGALSMDSTGIQFNGSSRPESLDAMGKLFKGIGKALPGEGKADKGDEAGPGQAEDDSEAPLETEEIEEEDVEA